MNALLRIAAWTLAIVLVALPVVAVLNGWIAGERWPMRRLAVTGEFRLRGHEWRFVGTTAEVSAGLAWRFASF